MFAVYSLLIGVVAIFIRIVLRYGVFVYKSTERLDGKLVIVTGANSGLGFSAAQLLAARGARVVLACRDERRALAARERIVAHTGNTRVLYKHLDLASLASVRKFCEDLLQTEEKIDVLVNNAGVYGFSDRLTADGIVESMQINHFGPFLLTNLLLPLLKNAKTARIVNVASIGHFFSLLNLDHINKENYYFKVFAYANSKLCNMIFTIELASRLKGTGVVANAVHPGFIMTEITAKYPLAKFGISIACWLFYRDTWEGVQTIVKLCVDPECGGEGGKFYMDGRPWPYSWRCWDSSFRRNLWRISEQLTGARYINSSVKS